MVANNCIALAVSTTGPVTAGCVFWPRHGCAVLLRSGEHVVLVGCIYAPLDHRTLLVKRSLLVDVVFVAMQLGQVCRYLNALGVKPRARANAVLGINPARTLCREIGMPRFAARPGSRGEVLAMPVGTGKPTEVSAIAEADTGDEKAHGVLLCLRWHAYAER